MQKLKKGDLVARISYGKDIVFVIEKIVKAKKQEIAILKGITQRIMADSPVEDLSIVDKRIVQEEEQKIESKLRQKLQYRKFFIYPFGLKRGEKEFQTGKILHLDGDKRYTQKSMRYYRSLGLTAIVKNIVEQKQPIFIKNLLEMYTPDILIITRT